MKDMGITVFAISIILLTSGCESDYTEINSYESQDEPTVTQEELDDAYSQGWDNAVSDVFSEHDELYNDDQQYSESDYQGQGYNSSSATSVVDAEQEGYDSAIGEVYSDTDVLSYGEAHYLVDDYQ